MINFKAAIPALIALLTVVMPHAVQAQAQGGDAQNGEQVFKKCMACHRVGEGAKSSVGPALTGVVGRKAGSFEGYSYSALNKAAGAAGLVWTEDLIFKYLEEPNTFLKALLTEKGKAEEAVGSTKMTFKLADANDRKDVIAYLQKFSDKK